LAFLAAASAAWSLASPRPGPGGTAADVVQPVATAVAVIVLLIVGLSARSRIAHIAALTVLSYQTAAFGFGIVTTGFVETFRFAAGIVGVVTLIVLILDWRRYWRSPRALSRGSLLSAVDWTLVLLYAVLTIVTVLLASWAVFHSTFGRELPDGPSELIVVASGFAAFAIAAGGLLLPLNGVGGAVLAFGGLMVAFGAFASEIRPADDVSAQQSELTGAGLALAGMFLLVRWSGR
jgi:hypothetical protein